MAPQGNHLEIELSAHSAIRSRAMNPVRQQGHSEYYGVTSPAVRGGRERARLVTARDLEVTQKARAFLRDKTPHLCLDTDVKVPKFRFEVYMTQSGTIIGSSHGALAGGESREGLSR